MTIEKILTADVQSTRDVPSPVCSTDQVWREDNMDRALTEDLQSIESTLSSCIKSLDTTITATAVNNSFSVSPTISFGNGGVYLLSVQYSTSSGLVDRATYAFKYDTSKLIQSVTTITPCYNSSDNFMATYRNGTLTFAASYNGTPAPTNITIKVI